MDRTKATILVVDDYADGRDAVALVLQGAGFRVETAASGAEACRLVLERRPELVILDVNLPDIDGFEVCRRLKTDPATASILVVHLSGTYRGVEDRIRGLDIGADAYLTKPVEPAELLATVRAMLRLQNVEGSLLESETRRRAAESLTAVAGILAQSLDLSVVGPRIVEKVRSLLGTLGCALYRVDAGTGDLIAVATTGDTPTFPAVPVLPRGTGTSGLAVDTKRPVISADVLTDARVRLSDELKKLIVDTPLRAAMAVPLLVEGRVTGALSVADRAARAFSEADALLLRAFADQIAVVMENARLYEEALVRRRQAEELMHVARTLTEELDPSSVAERVVECVSHYFNAGYADLRLLRADGALETIALGGSAAHLFERGHVMPAGDGVGGRAVAERRPVWSTDVLADPVFSRPADLRQRLELAGVHAILAVPLRVKGEIIGTLAIAHREARPFSQSEVHTVQAFADQAAVAMRNAALHLDLRTREGHLEVLLDASREIARIQPLPTLLTTLAEAGARLLDCDSVGFWLQEGDSLVLAGRTDRDAALPTARLRVGESLVGRVAAAGAPLLVPDLAQEPSLIEPHREVLLRLGLRAWLGVPLDTGTGLLGVLAARSRRPHGFTPDHVKMAQALAGHAAIALENSELVQRRQRAYEELAETKDQLTQAQKMEAVGQLAGGIAHDFNNMLAVILGRTELLQNQIVPDDPRRRHVNLIRSTSERAATLTQQLLAFGRKQVLQPRVLDLNEVLTGIKPMLRRLISESVELVTERDPELGRVWVDQLQTEQVILNLVVNAQDAMPDGGRLCLSTANAELDARFVAANPGARTGSFVTLAVSDTGVGMDAQIQRRIFEPFFTTKGAGKGTGLGLATVYGIVKQSDGYIAVASAPGRGSTFTVYLPRIEAPLGPPDGDEAWESPAAGHETVLLVEDDKDLRELIRETLEGHGYRVLEAGRPREALVVLEQHPDAIQLLLTDVVMPEMSGRELADRVSVRREGLRVLFVSGYADDEIIRHGVLEAGVAFLAKPFTPNTLARKVREVLDRRPTI